MSEEKILSGNNVANITDAILGSDGSVVAKKEMVQTSLKERIAASTEAGGLKELPIDFDDESGDWRTINSSDPFELLYLDYRQYKFVKPEIVNNNYTILEKFWRNKVGLMNTGGNRISFKNKYGDGTVETSLKRLSNAFEKLNSKQGIDQYYTEVNTARIKKGEEALKHTLQHMVIDDDANRSEIKLCLDRGLEYDLTVEETAAIIKRHLDSANFVPYGTPEGNTLSERLLSTTWMTPEKIRKEREHQEAMRKTLIQILPGKYASTIEEIGSILFEDPVEAKEIIREDLLKQVIAQKDMVVAREVGAISKDAKNLDLAFLAIVYKLNPKLPFRLMPGRDAMTVKDLCALSFENDQTIKVSKEHLKKGHTETWLKETDKNAYNVFIQIRDTAENLELAFIRFLYTFNPDLGYRLGGKELVKTSLELSAAINKSRGNWEYGKVELFNSFISTWLYTIGETDVASRWEKIKNKFTEREDIGLEYFLRLLDPSLQQSKINTDVSELSYPAIQSGQVITKEIVFANETRGCAEINLAFSEDIPGVSLSANKLDINNVTGANIASVTITIDSGVLLKGVSYDTSIVAVTSDQQRIEIPVSFRIVFPKDGFIKDVSKYAALVGAFFLFIRGVLSMEYADWLNTRFDAFVPWNDAWERYGQFGIFGGVFFVFLLGTGLGIYFLIKYLRK